MVLVGKNIKIISGHAKWIQFSLEPEAEADLEREALREYPCFKIYLFGVKLYNVI